MTRHQRHIRLLDHLSRLGCKILKVSNGTNTCRVRMISVAGKPVHQFGISRKYGLKTPNIVPFKGCGSPSLVFTVVDADGQRANLLGWRNIADWVQIEEEKYQNACRRLAE